MDDNQIREFHEKLSERIAVLEERNDKLLVFSIRKSVAKDPLYASGPNFCGGRFPRA